MTCVLRDKPHRSALGSTSFYGCFPQLRQPTLHLTSPLRTRRYSPLCNLACLGSVPTRHLGLHYGITNCSPASRDHGLLSCITGSRILVCMTASQLANRQLGFFSSFARVLYRHLHSRLARSASTTLSAHTLGACMFASRASQLISLPGSVGSALVTNTAAHRRSLSLLVSGFPRLT